MKVVFIDIDSLRPDHIGAYGYEMETTPNIDELADDGIVFNRAYAANSPCMPSRAALLTGRYGINNGVETHRVPGRTLNWPHTWEGVENSPEEWWTLPELFFKCGITACAISSFPRHPAPWFYHVWNEFTNPLEPAGPNEYFQTVRADTIADIALNKINQEADEDLLLYAQFWDPHTPYNRSREEIEQFSDVELPEFPTEDQIAAHNEWDAWHSANQEGISNREDLRETIAHYDAEIRFADHNVGRILNTLKENSIYEDSLVIVTADHGEEFGEHGLYREHWSTYDGTQRVPLIVKPPQNIEHESRTENKLVTNVDLPPTIADCAGFQIPSSWQGRSLRPLLHDGDTDWRNFIVVDHGLYTAQRAVRTDRWKFIYTYHPGMWSGVLDEKQLFDMKKDPWEQENIAPSHPDVVEDLEQKMELWAENHVGNSEDSLHAVARDGPAGEEMYEAMKKDWEGV